MKKITPDAIYEGLPCSVVAVGCAKGIARKDDLRALISKDLQEDGYLSLNGMNKLIRANLRVKNRVIYKRGERPMLVEFAHGAGKGKKAIICVLGHYIYFDGKDYYSYFFNGKDQVVSVWYLKEEK